MPTRCEPLADAFRRFVRFKRRLGCKYPGVEHSFRAANRYLAERGIRTLAEITEAHLQAWLVVRRQEVGQTTMALELDWLRRLFRFLLSRGKVSHDPTARLPRVRPPQHVPFVFSVAQMRLLLNEGVTVFRRPWTRLLYATIFHLLYATGMRISEALKLRVADWDRHRETLLVRNTKFHKSRLMPIGRRVGENLERYLAERKRRGARVRASDFLFRPSPMRRSLVRCHSRSVRSALRTMLRRVGLDLPRRDEGSRVYSRPRVHSLRHSFAVHRLLKWYRDGHDVNRKLILLTTYMGHSDIKHTQVYLTVSDVVLVEARKRVEDALRLGGRP